MNRYVINFRPPIWATSVIFKTPAQSKDSPNRREFAQSGHPDLWILHLHNICLSLDGRMTHRTFAVDASQKVV
jgi:hypothetical protein